MQIAAAWCQEKPSILSYQSWKLIGAAGRKRKDAAQRCGAKMRRKDAAQRCGEKEVKTQCPGK